MTSDDLKTAQGPAFRPAGIGFTSSLLCAYCDKPCPRLGSKLVGPLRRIRCARCVKSYAEREQARV